MTRPLLRLVPPSHRSRVVIVGAGFGGLTAARELGRKGVDVTVIDRRNHHLFQPLLYQVATAGLSPADIAAPIRAILKDLPSVRVLMDEVVGIDADARLVQTIGGAALPYDHLIIATGARHGYFGNEAWAEHAPGIKTLDDAVRVRCDILLAMERAETARQEDIARRDEPVTFAVIGGGPTGVEMAGAIAELTRHAASMEFRHLDPSRVRVLLIEGGGRLLASFSPESSLAALSSLSDLGVEVMLGARVTGVTAEGVQVGGTTIPTAVTIWAAGVKASPAAEWLGVRADAAGRLAVKADLSVADRPNVYALGDTAACVDAAGRNVPGVAAAAKQQGLHVARTVLALLAGNPAPAPFRYRDHGSLATIGRRRAVADLGWAKLSGLAAWLLWSTAHLYFLVGFRNRLTVGATWLWSYLTFDRGARLITGLPEAQAVTVGVEEARRLVSA